MAFGPGSIAFTGFNADGKDNLAFVALEPIKAGTVITFTDNEWDGTAFANGESTWTWTAANDLVAGTVVTMDNLAAGQTATSNTGAIAFSEETNRNIDDAIEMVYAYVGDASAPTFLTAIANGVSYYEESGVLNNTGLEVGVNAVAFENTDYDTDIAVYNGPRATGENLANLLKVINDPTNWATQNTAADDSNDGTNPDAPLPSTPFTVDPNAQKITFSEGTRTVSHEEGDTGTVTYTFVVERTNGTTGTVDFRGYLNTDTTYPDDYPGETAWSEISGMIPEGQTSGTLTITVNGDHAFEADETFKVVLTSVSNDGATAYLSPNAAETEATGTIVADDTQQVIGFAADSTSVLVEEGNDGTKTVTFTVERSGGGGQDGDVAFSGFYNYGNTNAADYGGPLPPSSFSGTILAGQTSATLTVTIAGDQLAEGNETFGFFLTSATNPAAENVALGVQFANAYILNDDGPAVVRSGETFDSIGLSGQASLTIEQGGTLTNLSVVGENFDATIINAGRFGFGGTGLVGAQPGNGKITFDNEATGVVNGITLPNYPTAGSLEFVLDNAGQVGSFGARQSPNYSTITINNEAGGVIGSTSFRSGMELLGNATINNAGTIITYVGTREGIEYNGQNVVVNNLAGGLIDGQHHAVTGNGAVLVTNEAGGTLIGRNGSAVNIDNFATVDQTVTVINHGLMQGRSANTIDSDGDAIDTDGLATVENWGTIEGLGHSGSHNGGLNVSEGIASGGGSITNHEGGTIAGYGRAIQVDNSSEGGAFAAVTIDNAGTIHGYGNLPLRFTGSVPPFSEATDYASVINGGEAINIVGTFADTLTNSGAIIGGVRMDGGDDVFVNSGSITATGGSALSMGDGNDTVTLDGGSHIEGQILLGAGDDVLLAAPSIATDLKIDAGIGDDRIDGGLGDDTLFGDLGDDLIQAGAGNDVIDGGADDDVIFGDDGADIITGGLGDDLVRGNAGDDVFVVATTADGRDSYDGGAGLDTLDFSAFTSAVSLTLRDGVTTFATDKIENVENVVGGQAADMLTGNAGDNALTGNAGDDLIRGGAGNDRLSGGLDNDDLQGGAGNDVLAGGAGDDVLTGGAGQDTFVFANLGDGIDTIADFRLSGSSADQIGLSSSLFTNFAGDDVFDLIGSGFLRAVAGENGTSIQIDHDGGGNGFETIAVLDGSLTNGMLADHSFLI